MVQYSDGGVLNSGSWNTSVTAAATAVEIIKMSEGSAQGTGTTAVGSFTITAKEDFAHMNGAVLEGSLIADVPSDQFSDLALQVSAEKTFQNNISVTYPANMTYAEWVRHGGTINKMGSTFLPLNHTLNSGQSIDLVINATSSHADGWAGFVGSARLIGTGFI